MQETIALSVFYLSVGSGHQMAARAVGEAWQRQCPDAPVKVSDPFASAIEILPAILDRIQTASIMLTPTIYENLWRRGSSLNIYDWITDIGIMQDLLMEELHEHPCEVVVASHALPFALAHEIKQRTGVVHKVFGVITDFGAHSFWSTKDVDGYFVGHEDVRQMLIYRGCKADKIHVTGIPLRLGFEKLADRGEELQPERLRVLLMAGGVRSGAYIGTKRYSQDLLEAITQLGEPKIQVSAVAGNQEALQNDLEKYKGRVSFELRVYGLVEDVPDLMAEHDLIITKPGGLIISEALASGLGLILTRPGPGQEAANVDFLARHGAAMRGETPMEAVEVLERCLKNPELVRQMKSRAKQLGHPYAAQSVVQHILGTAGDA